VGRPRLAPYDAGRLVIDFEPTLMLGNGGKRIVAPGEHEFGRSIQPHAEISTMVKLLPTMEAASPRGAYRAPRSVTALRINRYVARRKGSSARARKHLEGRSFIVGNSFTIVDISAWGWIDRAKFVLPGATIRLLRFPTSSVGSNRSTKRQPSQGARAGRTHAFKKKSTRRRGARCSLQLSAAA